MRKLIQHIRSYFSSPSPNTGENKAISIPIITTDKEALAPLPKEELSEAEEQQQQLLELLQSEDLSNHELALIFFSSLDIPFNEEFILCVKSSARKLSFWLDHQAEVLNEAITHLSIESNFFKQYDDIALFAQALPKLTSLKTFCWNAGKYWNQYPVIVAAIQIKGLENLSILNANLHYLPPEIGQLQNLRKLILSNNALEGLPESTSQLLLLEQLDISGNKFKRIPSEIASLLYLKKFDCTENPLKSFNLRQFTGLYALEILKIPQDLAEYYREQIQEWFPKIKLNNIDK